jgi:uncharacterized protein (DUF1778 family)
MMEAFMSSDATREANIHVRARPADRDLIDRAAAQLGKSRSEFVIETMRREAQEVLLDQTIFHVDAKTWKAFVAELDRPPRDNPRLRALMHRKAPWEA